MHYVQNLTSKALAISSARTHPPCTHFTCSGPRDLLDILLATLSSSLFYFHGNAAPTTKVMLRPHTRRPDHGFLQSRCACYKGAAPACFSSRPYTISPLPHSLSFPYGPCAMRRPPAKEHMRFVPRILSLPRCPDQPVSSPSLRRDATCRMCPPSSSSPLNQP